MQCCAFESDDKSQELCAIAMLFGLCESKRLPTGIRVLPNIAQDAIEKVLHDIKDVEAHIDDIGCFSSDWEAHLLLSEKVFAFHPFTQIFSHFSLKFFWVWTDFFAAIFLDGKIFVLFGCASLGLALPSITQN